MKMILVQKTMIAYVTDHHQKNLQTFHLMKEKNLMVAYMTGIVLHIACTLKSRFNQEVFKKIAGEINVVFKVRACRGQN